MAPVISYDNQVCLLLSQFFYYIRLLIKMQIEMYVYRENIRKTSTKIMNRTFELKKKEFSTILQL